MRVVTKDIVKIVIWRPVKFETLSELVEFLATYSKEPCYVARYYDRILMCPAKMYFETKDYVAYIILPYYTLDFDGKGKYICFTHNGKVEIVNSVEELSKCTFYFYVFKGCFEYEEEIFKYIKEIERGEVHD